MDNLPDLVMGLTKLLIGILHSILSNTIFVFILGNVAGFYIWRHLENAHKWWASFLEGRRLERGNRMWQKYKDLAPGLEVVQRGWRNREFTKEQVVVKVERAFHLPADIDSRTRATHEAEWAALNLEDNPQVGIFAIDAWRVSDKPLQRSHELRLTAQTYKYFDFLATHRLLLSGTREEQDFLRQKVGVPNYLMPVADFPTPLSVGLSLFCENGNCLVLTRRTTLASSGGLWWGNSIFNAIGENVSLEKDQVGEHFGEALVSPWNTGMRGLREEMGFEDDDCAGLDIHLHSFAWDKRILDYKFFGYTVSPLSRSELQQRCWTTASDRHENREINFVECRTRRQCAAIVHNIQTHKSEWSSEAILCTVLSLIYLKDTSWVKLI